MYLNAADLSISPSSIDLNSEISINGSGYDVEGNYLILSDNGGPFFSKSGFTEYEGVSSVQITSDSFISSTPLDVGSYPNYWSYNYEDFDKVVFKITYYDNTVASPLFTIVSHDIIASNHDSTGICEIEGTGSNTWITDYCIMEKNIGTTYKYSSIVPNTSEVYISDFAKYPAFEVSPDISGDINIVIKSPHRDCLLVDGETASFDKSCSYSLFNVDTEERELIGEIELSYDFVNSREIRDLLKFKYETISPQDLDTNQAAIPASKVFYADPYTMIGSWDLGYLGPIYSELGLSDLESQFYSKLPDVYGPNGEFLDLDYDGTAWEATLGNTSDNNIAAYHYLLPKYQNGDTNVKSLMDKIIEYTRQSYNETEGLSSTTIIRDPTRIWIDGLGIGKIEYMYAYGEEFDTDDSDYAKNTLTLMIDEMQQPGGNFVHDYNWDTGEIDTFDPDNNVLSEEEWWCLDQTWALLGLTGMQDLFEDYNETDNDIVTKVDQSIRDLLDHLTLSESKAKMMTNPPRLPILLYALKEIRQKPDYSEYHSMIDEIEEQLLMAALIQYRVEYPLSNIGWIYKRGYDEEGVNKWRTNTFIGPDLYLLKYLSEYKDDTYYIPNSSDNPFNYQFKTEDGYLYLGREREVSFSFDNIQPWSGYSGVSYETNNEKIMVSGMIEGERVQKFNKSNFKIENLDGVLNDVSADNNIYSFTLTATNSPSFSFTIDGLIEGERYQLDKNGENIEIFTVSSNNAIQASVNESGEYILRPYQVSEEPPVPQPQINPNSQDPSPQPQVDPNPQDSLDVEPDEDSNLGSESSPREINQQVDDVLVEMEELPNTAIFDDDSDLLIMYALLLLSLAGVIAFVPLEIVSNAETQRKRHEKYKKRRREEIERYEQNILCSCFR
jgi:hypothetical protein